MAQANDEQWTVERLKELVGARATSPQLQLLAMFDVVINLAGANRPDEVAIGGRLATRELAQALAKDAGLADPESFAMAWAVLLNGLVVAKHSGEEAAAGTAKAAGTIALKFWPRTNGGA